MIYKYKNEKRIGIIRGGKGNHYEDSIAKGGEIISNILENLSDTYKPVDVLIDRDGVWHIGGLPVQPADLMHRVEAVWNVSHSNLNNILENLSIPNIGVSSFSKTVGDSRDMLREHMKKIGVNMPRHILFPAYQEDFDGPRNKYALRKAKEVHEKFPAPWIVKSLTTDKNVGVHVVKTFPELADAIEDISLHGESILVEELISGKNAFMHTISGFRGEDVYAFPAGNFSKNEKEELINTAKNIHQHIGVPDYLKSNFVINPRNGIYLTSVEFSPDFKNGSHLDKACESVGAKMHQIVRHILDLSLL